MTYNYNYWYEDIRKFKERFAEGFDIPNCEIDIRENDDTNIPGICWGRIQMPSQYLEMLNIQCNLILSNQNILKNIGDYKNEKLNKEKYEIPNYILNPNDFKNKYLLNIEKVIPNDENRRNVAALIRDFISYFAIYHEIGHARQLAFILNDEASCQKSEVNKWANQAMEVDADIFAINWFWRTIFINYHNSISDKYGFTRHELISIALYSIFLFFVLSDDNKSIINPNADYPHPVVRIEILSSYIKKIILNNLFTIKEFEEVLKISLPELRKTLIYHFGLDYQLYFDKFKSEELKEAKIMIDASLKSNPALNFNRAHHAE